MKKIIIMLLLTSTFNILNAQNNYFSIGTKHNGLCFGNSKKYNGLRFNFWDNNVDTFNGFNLSILTNSKKSNGIRIGLLGCNDSLQNGITTGGLVIDAEKLNGIAIAGLAIGGRKFNGIAIAGLIIPGDTLNGLFISILGTGKINGEITEQINGVTIGCLVGAVCNKLNGLAIGVFGNQIKIQHGVSIGIYNNTEDLHGIQIGIVNYAKNNKYFKMTPFINFNFRKKKRNNNL